ncbi:MAG: hypothetical protein QOF76_1490 [Solirubrobacteraceae bacterium]|jgi:hypothetical protein|nr:hypothetical protein [Solirubrobacteraceae bacterium]
MLRRVAPITLPLALVFADAKPITKRLKLKITGRFTTHVLTVGFQS